VPHHDLNQEWKIQPTIYSNGLVHHETSGKIKKLPDYDWQFLSKDGSGDLLLV